MTEQTMTPIDARDARRAYFTGLLGDADQAVHAESIIHTAQAIDPGVIQRQVADRKARINLARADRLAAGTDAPATGRILCMHQEISLLHALMNIHDISLKVRTGDDRPV